MKRLLALSLLAVILTAATTSRGADEEQYKKWMKEAGGAGGRVKKALEASNGEAAMKDAEKVAALFKDMAGFWEGKKISDATKWSKESEAAAKKIAEAAKAGDLAAAKEHLGAYQKTCKGCHEAHREKIAEHEYKFKY